MTDHSFASSLVDRYRIERELGEGGMASVYLAEDLKHERHVAVKVLHRDLAASLGAERFLAEIRTTAKLQHPNILTLIDSGEAAGRLFYVMPFVDGESLRTRMLQNGRLPVAEALRIAAQVADALHHAHRLGVVHRDVKPENVLLRDGHAFVADFGVALSTASGGPRLTQAGLSLGTPLYMSPEQFLGDTVDGRSDLYALACMLFEMLTGVLPHSGDSAQALLAQRLTQNAPRVRTLRPDVPAMVDLVLARALSREPDERHASLAEFGAALQTEWSGATARDAGASRNAIPSLPGRAREVADALDMLEGLGRGKGGLLLIAGEPGVGKTRLANTVLTAARSRGALALIGRCYEMEGTPPFTPFAEVLDYVTRLVPPGEFRSALGDAAPEIARVQPLLRQAFPDIPDAVELPPDRVRVHLHNKYREFTARAAADLPQVVLFDDLHWADESSLALLEYLAGAVSDIPVLMIGTYRDTDLDVRRPFAAVLERLTRQRLAKRVALRRLGTDGVAEQLSALGGSVPPEPLVALLHRETDGNPFFVEEVFQHLREEGRLFDARGEWRTDLTEDQIDVPEGVRLVVGRRLERLGDPVQAMLTTAAVIGPRFALSVLLAAHDQSEDTVLDLLDVATAAQLLVEQRGGREVVYAFSHELIRQTLLAGLSMPRRQRKHLKVAEAFERTYGDRVMQKVADVAHHLYQAGAAAPPDRTVHFLIEASRLALRSAAFVDAEVNSALAIGFADLVGALQLSAAHQLRAEALLGLSRWSESHQQFLKALEYAQTAGDKRQVATLAVKQMDVGIWVADWGDVSKIVHSAVAFTENEDLEERVALLAASAAARLFRDGTPDYALFAEADLLVDRLGIPSLRKHVLFSRCNVAVAMGNVAEVIRTGCEAAPLFGDPASRLSYCEVAGKEHWFRSYTGDYSRTTETAALRAIAAESGNTGLVVSCDNYHLLSELTTRLPLASADAALVEVAQRWSVGSWNNLLWFYRGPILIEAGRASEVLDAARAAYAAMPRTTWDGLCQGVELLAATYGDLKRLHEVYAEHEWLVPAHGQPLTIGKRNFALLLSHIGYRTGNSELLANLRSVHASSRDVGMRTVGPYIVLAHEALGYASVEDFAAAEERFQEAALFAAKIDNRRGLLETLRWYAAMLVRRRASGDVERARECLGQAIELAESLGYGLTLHEMRSELVTCG